MNAEEIQTMADFHKHENAPEDYSPKACADCGQLRQFDELDVVTINPGTPEAKDLLVCDSNHGCGA
jgi:hypothetical protein